MLALPISTRAIAVESTNLQKHATPVLDEFCVNPRTIVWKGLKLKVKRTFIDCEMLDSEANQQNCRKLRRAQTCIGNTLSFAPFEQVKQLFDASLPSSPQARTRACDLLSDDPSRYASLTTSCGFPITVKNTFIEVKLPELEYDADYNVHPGACTCRASFEKLSFRFGGADEVSTDANSSDLSDIEGFENTPFDDSPFCDAPRRSFYLPIESSSPLACGMSGTSRETRPTLNLCSALSSATCVSACSDKSKTCYHWKSKGFCKVGQNCKFAHPAGKQGVGSTQRKKKDPSAEPLVGGFQAHHTASNSAVPSAACEEKSDKVCCHWKNKGWCKYQESCKFQHPAHKQGSGSAKRVRVPTMDS